MVAKTLKRAALGFLLGMVFGAFISIFCGLAFCGGELFISNVLRTATGSEAGAMLAQMLASGVYGAIPFAGIRILLWLLEFV